MKTSSLPLWERIALDWLEDQPTVSMPLECPLCPPGMALIDCPGHNGKKEAEHD